MFGLKLAAVTLPRNMVLPKFWRLDNGRNETLFADCWAYRHACSIVKLSAFLVEVKKREAATGSLWPALDAVSGTPARIKCWRAAERRKHVKALGAKVHKLSVNTLDWTGAVIEENTMQYSVNVAHFVRDAEQYGDELTDWSTLATILVIEEGVQARKSDAKEDAFTFVVNLASVCEKAERGDH